MQHLVFLARAELRNQVFGKNICPEILEIKKGMIGFI
jgi:hypothetical protein